MSKSIEENKQSSDELAQFIEKKIVEFVNTSPHNRLSFMNDHIIFDRPLVRFAQGDDPIFVEFKGIIASDHLTPSEALAHTYRKIPHELPSRLSVISWILPITEEARRSNRLETRVPSRLWSHTRWYGEKFNDRLREYVVDLLIKMGKMATAPMLQSYFKINSNEKGAYSNW